MGWVRSRKRHKQKSPSEEDDRNHKENQMNKKSLIIKADALFATFWHRHHKCCAIEGCNNPCELCHLISRGNHLFRWDPRNIINLCSWHHKNSKLLSHHGSPEAFKEWMKQNKPEQYEFWQSNKNKIGVSIPEYWYREQVEEIKSW